MENDQNTSLNNIIYPRTPGDHIAEMNVINGDPDIRISLGELMLLDQMQPQGSELSLDVRSKFVRTPADDYAEKFVDWREQLDKLKPEARMRVETLQGIKPGESGWEEAYTEQLESLQIFFGITKPVKLAATE